MPSTSNSQPTSGSPHILYISYDGVCEPLGRSQVLAYLFRLASDFSFTLISFEKPGEDLSPTAKELAQHGIEWVPLRYHRRPPVLSTLLDVVAGRRAAVRVARTRAKPAIVHVRSYVAALIALLARGHTGGAFLFDIRGFWADERVDGGLWRSGGLLYRIAKRCERRFFAEADGIVTLTDASVDQIRAWAGERDVPVEVIPTCVDLERFSARPLRSGGPHAVWCGSVGTWYRFDLAPRVAAALSLPLTVITRQTELASELVEDRAASIRSVSPDEVPEQLCERDVGLCLIVSSFSKTASAPTRFAEYLAAGMPVLVTRGVGDLEQLVQSHRVGAVLGGDDDHMIKVAADTLLALRDDPQLPDRCRELARDRFDVQAGSELYGRLYVRLLAASTGDRRR